MDELKTKKPPAPISQGNQIDRIHEELDKLANQQSGLRIFSRIPLPDWFNKIPWYRILPRRWALGVFLFLMFLSLNGFYYIREGIFTKADAQREAYLYAHISGNPLNVSEIQNKLSKLKETDRHHYLLIIRNVRSIVIEDTNDPNCYGKKVTSSSNTSSGDSAFDQFVSVTSFLLTDRFNDPYQFVDLSTCKYGGLYIGGGSVVLRSTSLQTLQHEAAHPYFSRLPLYRKLYVIYFQANPFFHPFNYHYASEYIGYPVVEEQAVSHLGGSIPGVTVSEIATDIQEAVRKSYRELGWAIDQCNPRYSCDVDIPGIFKSDLYTNIGRYVSASLQYPIGAASFTFFKSFYADTVVALSGIYLEKELATRTEHTEEKVRDVAVSWVKVMVGRFLPVALIILLVVFWPRIVYWLYSVSGRKTNVY